jgi:hypothetical protein
MRYAANIEESGGNVRAENGLLCVPSIMSFMKNS